MKKDIQYIKDIPRLAMEFDTEANEVPIDYISTGSGKKIYWVCEKGHKWRSTPHHRAKRGQNCPYCAGMRLIPGENDLTVFPSLIKEWHPTKNGDLKPEELMYNSGKKVWWLCSKGHEYETRINLRVGRGFGCPYCSKKFVKAGETDLATLRPEIAAEWHPVKNGNLMPHMVTSVCRTKCWWVCPKGHEYEMNICDRTGKTRPKGCPYCAGKRPIKGENDFGTVCKEANLFWDFIKNDATPSDYLPNSKASVWMKCSHGHIWETYILEFTRKPRCPYCSGVKLIKDVNTLKILHPDIAGKWDYEKNANTDIDTVHVGSSTKMYWWKCEKDHSWIASVVNMVRAKGSGCPYCAGLISKYSI